MKLEIAKMLVASTAHITEEDSKWLDAIVHSSATPPIVVVDRPGTGWFVHVDATLTEENLCQFSTAFCKLMQLAWSHDIGWIMLDSDGPLYVEKQPLFDLEVHDW